MSQDHDLVLAALDAVRRYRADALDADVGAEPRADLLGVLCARWPLAVLDAARVAREQLGLEP